MMRNLFILVMLTGIILVVVTVYTKVGNAQQCDTEGSACDDGNPCTINDQCQSGECVGTVVANDTPCDDGNACTERDTCSQGECQGAFSCVAIGPCIRGYGCDPNIGCVVDYKDKGDDCTQLSGPCLDHQECNENHQCIDILVEDGLPCNFESGVCVAGDCVGCDCNSPDAITNPALVFLGKSYFLGTLHSDTICTTEGEDVVYAWSGDDCIATFGGDDKIYAGPGDDFVDAGDGFDKIIGGFGTDECVGGESLISCEIQP